VRDLAALDRPDLGALERHHRDGFAVQRDELDLERFAGAMHVHHGAHVPARELVARQVGRQHNAVVFSDRNHVAEADMKRRRSEHRISNRFRGLIPQHDESFTVARAG
jgi:hypothetical protein